MSGISFADFVYLLSELSLLLLLFSPLLIAGTVFTVCLVRFCRAQRGEARRRRRTGLIVSSVVCAFFLALYVTFFILLVNGIMGM